MNASIGTQPGGLNSDASLNVAQFPWIIANDIGKCQSNHVHRLRARRPIFNMLLYNSKIFHQTGNTLIRESIHCWL